MFGKRKIAALVAEFLGTGILTLLVLSVQRSTVGVPLFVALMAGLATIVAYYILSSVSGGYFNPAITIGFWTARKLSTLTTIVYVAFEMLGGYAAFRLYCYYVHTKLTSIGGHFSGRTLAAEAVGAAILGLVWAAASFQNWSKGFAGAAIGLGAIVGMLSASAAGIGLINPALALGVNAVIWGTYMLGPVLGAVIGINLYSLLFATKEEIATANFPVENMFSANANTSTSSTSVAAKKPATIKPSTVVADKTKKPVAKKKSATTAKKTTKKTKK